MDTENIKFTIDQLRQDKIIYAVESCAVNLICILILIISETYLTGLAIKDIVNFFAIFIAVSYTIFMGLGNAVRLSKIKKFEKKLNN